MEFSKVEDVTTGDVYVSNDGAVEFYDLPKASISNVNISSIGYVSINDVAQVNIGNIKAVRDEKPSSNHNQSPINDEEGSAVSFYGKTNANVNNIDLSNGADVDIGNGASVKVNKLTSDYSYLYMDLGDMSDGKPSLTANELSLNNGSEIVCASQDGDEYKVAHEAAGKFTFGRLNVNNSKISFGQEASVKFDNQLAEDSGLKDSGLYVSNGGAVNFNGTDVAADTVKADAGTVSLKHSTGTFGNVELTQGQ